MRSELERISWILCDLRVSAVGKHPNGKLWIVEPGRLWIHEPLES
jgi:hypothetical protein